MTTTLWLVHFASTWYLVGLCWLVQRVQYPLMAKVGTAGFADYERAHVVQIGPVVAPAMVLELLSGLALCAWGGALARQPLFLVSVGVIAAIWASTFLIQVPLHEVLQQGFRDDVHARLVRTNWLRTIGWTLRGGILLWLFARAVPPTGA